MSTLRPYYMGANGVHFWNFRITGRQYFAKGGMLSIMQPTFDRDWHGLTDNSLLIINCDLYPCFFNL